MNLRAREALSSVGLLIIRVGIAGYLATHGWGKFQQVMEGNFQFADPIGIGEKWSLILAMGAEFICSLLVMIGLGTRLAAAPVVFTMGVAAFIAHGSNPWTAGEGYRLFSEKLAESWASKEPALIFLIVFLGLMFTGAGRFSVDALICRKKERAASEPLAGGGAA
jgi:putative oxidoreductase